MKVRQGWSGETSHNVWEKFDVTLDDADLRRILRDNDIAAESDSLPVNLVFNLMEAEAAKLIFAKLVQFGLSADAAQHKITALTQRTAQILAALR